jgi:acetyl/propionyl-CoA carboxylase alpha subunit
MSSELRRSICEAAVAAGRAIGYTNAGTIEFILAPSGEFYFIEVNTRLQVEHPVTEMITGVDLVKLQIEIACDKPLSLAQAEIKQNGHAIEARLYAENPCNGFLPATGILREWDPPSIEGLRIDPGVAPGAEVGIHYDPILAKLIAHASDRESARRRLAFGLANLFAAGVQTNREFLIKAIEHAEFASGNYHTGFVDQHLDELIMQTNESEDLIAASVVALFISKRLQAEAATLPNLPPCYRNNRFRDPSIKLQVGGVSVDLSWRPIGNESFTMSSGDWQVNFELVSFERDRIRASIDGIQRMFRISEAGDQFFVQANFLARVVRRLPRYPHAQAASEHESAYAPMPGQVLRVLVEVGQRVLAGDALVILEAMKMEQTLRAATEGRVETVLVKQGDVVAPGDRLVEIAAAISEA